MVRRNGPRARGIGRCSPGGPGGVRREPPEALGSGEVGGAERQAGGPGLPDRDRGPEGQPPCGPGFQVVPDKPEWPEHEPSPDGGAALPVQPGCQRRYRAAAHNLGAGCALGWAVRTHQSLGWWGRTTHAWAWRWSSDSRSPSPVGTATSPSRTEIPSVSPCPPRGAPG